MQVMFIAATLRLRASVCVAFDLIHLNATPLRGMRGNVLPTAVLDSNALQVLTLQ